jgi:hypothetical protein
LGSAYAGFPFLYDYNNKTKDEWLWSKHDPEWEFAELYYPVYTTKDFI